MRLHSLSIFLLLLLFLTGCASNIPETISKPVSPALELNQVRDSLDTYKGQSIRWGGEIASVEPLQDNTLVEIVERNLGSYGRPDDGDASDGRFIARISSFIDPAVYKEGRLFTVSGVVAESMKKAIGEHQYVYPVVDVVSHHLWEPLPQHYQRDYYPWYYDPFYDPWGSPYYWHHRPYYWW